jgi:hypothetical protein
MCAVTAHSEKAPTLSAERTLALREALVSLTGWREILL